MASRKPKVEVSMDGHVVAGFEARRVGMDRRAVPHDPGPEYVAWQRGWDKCDRELKERA